MDNCIAVVTKITFDRKKLVIVISNFATKPTGSTTKRLSKRKYLLIQQFLMMISTYSDSDFSIDPNLL